MNFTSQETLSKPLSLYRGTVLIPENNNEKHGISDNGRDRRIYKTITTQCEKRHGQGGGEHRGKGPNILSSRWGQRRFPGDITEIQLEEQKLNYQTAFCRNKPFRNKEKRWKKVWVLSRLFFLITESEFCSKKKIPERVSRGTTW